MTLDDLERLNRIFYGFFADFGLRDTFQERIALKPIEIDTDKLRMEFLALNVDFDGLSLNFVGSRKPAHEGIKERYPRKSRYCTVVGQSFVKTAGDRLTVCEHTSNTGLSTLPDWNRWPKYLRSLCHMTFSFPISRLSTVREHNTLKCITLTFTKVILFAGLRHLAIHSWYSYVIINQANKTKCKKYTCVFEITVHLFCSPPNTLFWLWVSEQFNQFTKYIKSKILKKFFFLLSPSL